MKGMSKACMTGAGPKKEWVGYEVVDTVKQLEGSEWEQKYAYGPPWANQL